MTMKMYSYLTSHKILNNPFTGVNIYDIENYLTFIDGTLSGDHEKNPPSEGGIHNSLQETSDDIIWLIFIPTCEDCNFYTGKIHNYPSTISQIMIMWWIRRVH